MQPIYIYCCHEKDYRKNQKMKFNKFPINIGYYNDYNDYKTATYFANYHVIIVILKFECLNEIQLKR